MTAPDLFSYEPAPAPERVPYVKGSATSKEAAESIAPIAAGLEIIVLDAIREAGPKGLTSDEAERILKMRHQTTSARFNGLKRKGLIRETVERRRTSSGRQASVYVAASL